MYTRLCFYLSEKIYAAAERARQNSESGQGMVEYALLAGFVAMSAGAMSASPLTTVGLQRIWLKVGFYVALAASSIQWVSL
jgi:Flp pilus assembly pilin Flp